MQVTSVRMLRDVGPVPAGSGVRTAYQVRPFQCSISLRLPLPLESSPTAQQFRAFVQRTAAGTLLASAFVPPGFGTRTADHARPFQCSIWFTTAPAPVSRSPTAQQSLRPVQYTPVR